MNMYIYASQGASPSRRAAYVLGHRSLGFVRHYIVIIIIINYILSACPSIDRWPMMMINDINNIVWTPRMYIHVMQPRRFFGQVFRYETSLCDSRFSRNHNESS